MDDDTPAQPSEAPDEPRMQSKPVSTPATSPPSVPTPGFSNLEAPQPAVADPPPTARVIAFAAILVGGLLGGLVGYGIGDVLYPDSLWAAGGAVAGALTGAVGLGVLVNLTLRAMNEWESVSHPESDAEPHGAHRGPADPTR